MSIIVFIVSGVIALVTGFFSGYAFGLTTPRIPPDPRDTRGCDDADAEWAALSDAERARIIDEIQLRR
jgi:hypothetical protein